MSYKPLSGSDEYLAASDGDTNRTTPMGQFANGDKSPDNPAKDYRTSKPPLDSSDENKDHELTDSTSVSAAAPGFRVARIVLIILLFVMVLGLIAGSVALIIVSPSCPPQLLWWQEAVIYQAYPMSYQDTDGNGYGDLNGIRSRLDYLSNLSISTIWLNPIYSSPMHDNGYDIDNFYTINPLFGTMADFDELLSDLHSRKMNLLMDFVPNHTSDEHEWFKRSSNDSTGPFGDYYVWRDAGADGGPPNNWLSVFGGSAWTYSEGRDQYYLHQFKEQQPDLNYRNKNVRKQMENVLKFWLDKGVDGFRVDAVIFLLEDKEFRNEVRNDSNLNETDYNSLIHNYTTNVDGDHGIVKEWRKVLDCYSEPGLEKLFIGEIYSPVHTVMEYYGKNQFDFPFNFILVEITEWNATSVRFAVGQWMDSMSGGNWPNWVVGNHDNHRIASRVGVELAPAVNMLLLTLPGTPTTYYGEEISMIDLEDIPAGADERDYERSPMQWNTSEHAGFTNGTPWLPVGNYSTVNVEVQQEDPQSMLQLYRRLIALRQSTDSLRYTSYTAVTNISDSVFAFVRDHNEVVIVAINFSSEDLVEDLSVSPQIPTNTKFKVELSTLLNRTEPVDMANVHLAPFEGLVLKTV